jgi:nuclear autoantigenic sperm protein
MVCGEIPTAVNQFQEACAILSKAYGETAKECADAYFCYGQALLDLARMENGVLGNSSLHYRRVKEK